MLRWRHQRVPQWWAGRRRTPSTTCRVAPLSTSSTCPPVTKIAEEQHWLHWFMLILCTVIFVAVFSVMFYSDLEAPQVGGPQAGQFP
jgi:heme/copper-type cytochrome/quinol oxidase subunit 2